MPAPDRAAMTEVPVTRWPDGAGADTIAVEEPLEIRVEGVAAAITMRTPGDDFDLVIGFLATEGVIDGIDDVRAIAEVGENTVDVRLAEGVPAARARSADRQMYATSSCGICGKASLDRLVRAARPGPRWEPDPAMLATLPEALRALQPGFASTGGLHAAAVFDEHGGLTTLREDVGRHNAVDKVLGARLRAEEWDWTRRGLLVSSRAGFEIVQKALVSGVPVLCTLGAPTSLAVEAATRGGIALVGWLREDRFTRYAG
jgi:FdhD protein